ncbi:MAG: GH3 auxin-responsive promoter family protein [Pseudomonadota bacterium]|nr:GH3 auxin-responsive promoter family protein [Pseudomonadota bacterium]
MVYPPAGNGPYRLLRGFNAGAVRAFETSCAAPEAAQRTRLDVLLAGLRGTAFASDHGLTGAEDLDAWRAKVPIRTHAEQVGWLDRVAAGEADVLTRAPVRSLLETSGTTGRPKWLPVTAPWARTVADAQALWVLALLRDDEGLAKGKALSVVSPAEHMRSPGGLAVGSNTGRMFQAQPWWVRWRAPVPYAVYCVEDPTLRAYCVLRHALGQPVTSWTTANPSTLLLYCRRLVEWWEDLAADAHDGTLCRGPAAALTPKLRAALGGGPFGGLGRVRLGAEPLPAKIWNLRRVNCWMGGSAPFFLSRLPRALGAEIPVREVGVTASEGFFAIPVDDDASVAWLGGHLLEFVGDDGGPRMAWEVEVGREYRLVVSTEAGLYRYDLGDIVRIVGWCEGAPRMVFVRKAGNVLNAMGEKVTEDQVVTAARAAFPEAVGVSVSIGWGEIPVLRVAVEGDAAHPSSGDALERFDRSLRGSNVEYDGRRASGRMGLPTALWVGTGAFAAWREARVRAGAPDAQVKDPIVLDSDKWDALVTPGASR